MNEELKRRNLFPAIPEGAIGAVAARHGFAEPRSSTPQIVRRQRQPIGRNFQLNVKLRRETRDAIFEEANARNVPVAQVIEEAIEAKRGASDAGV
jgi:ABC-type uncharacterized transport system YnjBCD ATPase subunit